MHTATEAATHAAKRGGDTGGDLRGDTGGGARLLAAQKSTRSGAHLETHQHLQEPPLIGLRVGSARSAARPPGWPAGRVAAGRTASGRPASEPSLPVSQADRRARRARVARRSDRGKL
jgi:hypothetical protein